MHYTRTTEIITASSIAASNHYSDYYLNGRLLEIGLAEHTVQPLTTLCHIHLYRDTTALGNLIMKSYCPTSWAWRRPRFKITSTSTAAGMVALTSFLGGMEPMIFADERILIKVGETSQTAYRKFKLLTRIAGIATPADR